MITLITIENFTKTARQMLMAAVLVFFIVPVFGQGKKLVANHDLKEFNKELVDADLTFTFPAGFKEIKPASNSEDPSFDYGITLPNSDFEIWFEVKSLKDNKPIKLKGDKPVNPDSLYMDMGRAQASAFVGDDPYIIRNIPQPALARYNADAGKTFLLNLPDSPITKHFKYAMVVVLQKSHSGTLVATCFANELGPSFFKNVNQANSCIKFNQ